MTASATFRKSFVLASTQREDEANDKKQDHQKCCPVAPVRSISFKTNVDCSDAEGCDCSSTAEDDTKSSISSGSVNYLPPCSQDGEHNNNGVNRRKNNRITFSRTATVRYVAPVRELTDQPEALWFQKHEFQHIQKKALAIVKQANLDEEEMQNDSVAAMAGSSITKTKGKRRICIRGLEKYLTSQRDLLARRRVQGWDAVLSEQDLQHYHDYYNAYDIANAYTEGTSQVHKEAFERARRDAAEARRYCLKD